MKAAGGFHYEVIEIHFCIPKNIFYNAGFFYPGNDMFHDNPDTRNNAVLIFFDTGKRSAARFLFRLPGDHTFGFISLKAGIFIKHDSFRKCRIFLVADFFIVFFPFISSAEIYRLSTLRCHNHIVFHGMRFLFPAVIFFLFIRVLRSPLFPLRPVNDDFILVTLGQCGL